jgi:dTDP-4-amino-4,6-dideoxygalactose transaminase
MALKSLQLSPGCRVGVMAYNCHTVMNAVRQAGYEIVFIDVTKELTIDENDLRRKSDSLSAIIITHLFGVINDVQKIRSEYPDLIVIEDCAHAFGVEECGKSGNFSAYSIGQGKFPSVGEGGFLRVNDKSYLPAIIEQYEELPEYGLLRNIGLFCSMVFKSVLYIPWVYSTFTFPLLKKNRTLKVEETPIPLRKMSSGVFNLFEDGFPETEQIIGIQKQNAFRLSEWLSNDRNVIDCHVGNNAFMLVVDCINPDILQKKLMNLGVESAIHFGQCVEWIASFGGNTDDLPNTVYLSQHVLMIPTYKKFALE